MKEIWNTQKREYEMIPQNIDDFINDLHELYIKHNISISHEDTHGSFIFHKYNRENFDWIKEGINDTDDIEPI